MLAGVKLTTKFFYTSDNEPKNSTKTTKDNNECIESPVISAAKIHNSPIIASQIVPNDGTMLQRG